MPFGGGRFSGAQRVVALMVGVLLGLAPLGAQSHAEEFGGPVFKKGLWRFQRTLEISGGASKPANVLQAQDSVRCVDPTIAMKAIFSSPHIGNCRSSAAVKLDNRYTFANRCDYLGPVRTDITVHGDDAYSEVNEVRVGSLRPVDKVTAHRIGDCNLTN
jgi:hypothetical protein